MELFNTNSSYLLNFKFFYVVLEIMTFSSTVRCKQMEMAWQIFEWGPIFSSTISHSQSHFHGIEFYIWNGGVKFHSDSFQSKICYFVEKRWNLIG